jgi:cyclopropane-fatty-acyl-phospholipid synthase
MATQRDIDFTYTLIDKIFRLSIGETASFSGAKYDGDFSLTLEQAQQKKHDLVWEKLRLEPGQRVLDMGCGWGSLLHYLKARGVTAVGVTLSRGQWAACRRNGLDAHLVDCRTITRDTFGSFDAVASLGAFEAFCSPTQFRAGQQDEIYRSLFHAAADVLAPGGRFCVQTMVFGPNMVPAEAVDVHAPRESDAWIMGLLAKTFPGTWLPYGAEQVERAAAHEFREVYKENGRLDYIETIKQWEKRFAKFTLRKGLLYLSLLPRYLTSADFRYAFTSGVSANAIAFRRLLLDHFRIVFEKV